MLEIQGLGKQFGGAPVLSGVDLTMRQGEFFSLLGPSGCGKTTLLRILAGFERADSGSVRLAGEDMLAVPAHRRACNMIFQRYALFPHLDVAENVAFGPTVQGLAKAEVRRRVDEALALVAMGSFAGRAVETLSGGQQQRVAIARAIVNRPKVLLLDEPLSALDLQLRQKMQTELLELQRRLGINFVYVTHAQDEALALSDRIAVMNHGRLEQVGTPKEIYDEPATAFVATFIGQMNKLPGRAGAGGVFTSAGGTNFSTRASASGAATLLVRPERTRLAAPGRAGNRLPAVVSQLTFRGATVDVRGEVVGMPGFHFTSSVSRDDEATPLPAVGARVDFGFDPTDAQIFAGDLDA